MLLVVRCAGCGCELLSVECAGTCREGLGFVEAGEAAAAAAQLGGIGLV